MGFRKVRISKRCKLETSLDKLIIRDDNRLEIFLDEINILIIENQQVCITNALLNELIKHKIKVVLCDEKHNPVSEIVSYHGAYNTFERIKNQVNWDDEIKNKVWSEIIWQKINNQYLVLKSIGDERTADILLNYRREIQIGDSGNREGLAAKVYFLSLFGQGFDRRDDNKITNVYLNYGYSIILSAVNREISNAGYLTSFGIHHIGSENPFNFGCDLMEPFRPFVDRLIVKKIVNDDNYKSSFIKLLDCEILCDDNNTILENAIHNYVLSVFNALNTRRIDKIAKVTFKNEQL